MRSGGHSHERPSPSAGSRATEPRFSDPCGAWHTCTLAVPHLPPCWSCSPEQLCVPPPEQPYRLPTVLGAGGTPELRGPVRTGLHLGVSERGAVLRPGGWSLFPARQSGHRLHQSGRGGWGEGARGREQGWGPGAGAGAGGLGPEQELGLAPRRQCVVVPVSDSVESALKQCAACHGGAGPDLLGICCAELPAALLLTAQSLLASQLRSRAPFPENCLSGCFLCSQPACPPPAWAPLPGRLGHTLTLPHPPCLSPPMALCPRSVTARNSTFSPRTKVCAQSRCDPYDVCPAPTGAGHTVL